VLNKHTHCGGCNASFLAFEYFPRTTIDKVYTDPEEQQ
jgi:hypothetical protein